MIQYGVFEKQGSSKKELIEEIRKLNEQLHLENRYASFNVIRWLLKNITIGKSGKIKTTLPELVEKLRNVYGYNECIDSFELADKTRKIKIERRMKDIQRMNLKEV